MYDYVIKITRRDFEKVNIVENKISNEYFAIQYC